MSEQIVDVNTGEIVLSSNALRDEIANLAKGNLNIFSTVTATDFNSRKRVINAMSSSEPVADHLNKKLEVTDVIVQAIEMENEQTGKLQTVPRIVLLTADGKAYHAISDGLYRSVQNMLVVLGHPNTWPEPVGVTVSKEKGKAGNYFTAKIA